MKRWFVPVFSWALLAVAGCESEAARIERETAALHVEADGLLREIANTRAETISLPESIVRKLTDQRDLVVEQCGQQMARCGCVAR